MTGERPGTGPAGDGGATRAEFLGLWGFSLSRFGRGTNAERHRTSSRPAPIPQPRHRQSHGHAVGAQHPSYQPPCASCCPAGQKKHERFRPRFEPGRTIFAVLTFGAREPQISEGTNYEYVSVSVSLHLLQPGWWSAGWCFAQLSQLSFLSLLSRFPRFSLETCTFGHLCLESCRLRGVIRDRCVFE